MLYCTALLLQAACVFGQAIAPENRRRILPAKQPGNRVLSVTDSAASCPAPDNLFGSGSTSFCYGGSIRLYGPALAPAMVTALAGNTARQYRRQRRQCRLQ